MVLTMIAFNTLGLKCLLNHSVYKKSELQTGAL